MVAGRAETRFAVAFDLMLTLYGIKFHLPGIAEWRQRLRGER